MSENNSSYYSHIDSLRAIAVLTVILFHINHEYLPGGFVGVDTFFLSLGS
jgi:peptidoglycan/LPS O-acetylase OafA/YrhL